MSFLGAEGLGTCRTGMDNHIPSLFRTCFATMVFMAGIVGCYISPMKGGFYIGLFPFELAQGRR